MRHLRSEASVIPQTRVCFSTKEEQPGRCCVWDKLAAPPWASPRRRADPQGHCTWGCLRPEGCGSPRWPGSQHNHTSRQQETPFLASPVLSVTHPGEAQASAVLLNAPPVPKTAHAEGTTTKNRELTTEHSRLCSDLNSLWEACPSPHHAALYVPVPTALSPHQAGHLCVQGRLAVASARSS